MREIFYSAGSLRDLCIQALSIKVHVAKLPWPSRSLVVTRGINYVNRTLAFGKAALSRAMLGLLFAVALPMSTAHALPTYTASAAGNAHTCALVSSGGVQCWGSNVEGQLGNNNIGVNSNLPVDVVGIADAVAIGSGATTSCARLSDNTLRCWGNSISGQLGDGKGGVSPVPVQVSGIAIGTAVAGGALHMCARLVTGNLSCWGGNGTGALGLGPIGGTFPTPQSVPAFGSVSSIGIGSNHSCARMADATLRCWGSNSSGQVGDGTTAPVGAPTTVSGISNATSVGAGGSHTCARLSDGTLRCWGSNSSGQLGDATFTPRTTPVAVAEITGALLIALGQNHSCAIVGGGDVKCWGQGNFGQLGIGTSPTNRTVPSNVANITGATRLAAGAQHTCALIGGGRVYCWGNNSSGQLGNGTFINTVTPRAVRDGRCVLDIDGDGEINATTDLLLLTRAALGMNGTAVTQNALGANPLRGDWAAIRAYLTDDCGMTNLAP